MTFALTTAFAATEGKAGCTLPHTISNGQVADATKLMDNLQAAADCGAPAGPNNSVQINANGTNMGSVGPLTNGQVVVGSTGNAPVAATLAAGSGIAIANGPGSITISASGAATNWWFQPPLASQFTLASGDATNLALTDDEQAGLMVNGGVAVDGNVLRIAYQTLADKDADWDLKIRFSSIIPEYNFSGLGLMMRDSVSGRITTWDLRHTGQAALMNWYALVGYSGTPAAIEFRDSPVWYRIVHSGSSYTFYLSADGKSWTPSAGVADTSWLTNKADQVGFMIQYSRNYGIPNSMTIEYYELIQ